MPQFPAFIDLSTLDGITGFKLNGEAAYDQSGICVAAGDLNGDGFADLIVGAYFASPNGALEAGATYVVFGQASGFASRRSTWPTEAAMATSTSRRSTAPTASSSAERRRAI